MALANETVLIIGGSTGMGFAAGRTLLQAGARVHLCGRSPDKLESARRTLHEEGLTRCETHAVDQTNPVALAALFQAVGPIDHLVLAASTDAAWGAFEEVSADRLRTALEGKLLGYWQALQAALPCLRKDGSVVMLTGAAARTAIPGTSGLAAVNGAIVAMATTLARELAPLRVNVISPGLFDTPVYDALPAAAKTGLFTQTAKRLPVGRTGQPAEVGEAVRFMLSNGFTTGAVLDVDGGARMAA